MDVAIYHYIIDSFFSPSGVNLSYAILEKLSLAQRTPLHGRYLPPKHVTNEVIRQ